MAVLESLRCARCDALNPTGAHFCARCGSALGAPEAPAEDPLMARLRSATIGDYDVIQEIGRGGMAAVYLAWDIELARYVAIKVMLPDLSHHEAMPQRFLQEARTVASLDDHPNVVKVYAAKERRGQRLFVMKYIDGCTLGQLLQAARALPLPVAFYVLEQVANALHYAHARGIVHRDVKPANIMLDRHGVAIVTDFGIAKVTQGDSLTKTGFAIGTPPYMSPEQWRVEPLRSASDQYALGAVAHEMRAGAPPFGGTVVELQQGHLCEPPRRC